MSAVEIYKEQTPVTGVAVTPLEMLNRAVETGAAVETIEKLMALYERWDAAQSRKAYDAAIAEAKAEISPIVKNAVGHNNKKYADFSAIARVVDPVLSKHGLSYRFRTRQDERIHVTCVLSHRLGHSEETTLAGPADNSGSKNAIQAIGSTLTYLQRYSLVQALGIATAADDDGKAAGAGNTITDEQREQLQAKIVSVGADVPRFLRFLKVEKLEDLQASKFSEAMAALNAKESRSAD